MSEQNIIIYNTDDGKTSVYRLDMILAIYTDEQEIKELEQIIKASNK